MSISTRPRGRRSAGRADGASVRRHHLNHREAPITALDHEADITDVYAFVSYDANTAAGKSGRKATLILCGRSAARAGQRPDALSVRSGHPVRDQDRQQLRRRRRREFQFRFDTEYQLPNVFTAVAGFMDGAFQPGTRQPGRSAAHHGLRQPGPQSAADLHRHDGEGGSKPALNDDGSPFFAVPGNAGPRTMDYEALFAAWHLQACAPRVGLRRHDRRCVLD